MLYQFRATPAAVKLRVNVENLEDAADVGEIELFQSSKAFACYVAVGSDAQMLLQFLKYYYYFIVLREKLCLHSCALWNFGVHLNS